MRKFYLYDPEIKDLPYGWDHPIGVPKSPEELFSSYGDYIKGNLSRYNKVKQNLEDLYQDIWVRLVKADLIGKFTIGAARRLPISMSTLEVCLFLGIGLDTWFDFLLNHPVGKLIKPIPVVGRRVRRKSLEAFWDTATICEVDYEKFISCGPNRVRPPVTDYGFKSYLQRSIHNTYANCCRTHDRKYKEQLLSPQVRIKAQSDGCYTSSVKADASPSPSWEMNITSAMADEEGALDLLDHIRKARVDPNSEEGSKIIDYMIKQGKQEEGPRKNIALLGFLGEGQSFKEAAFNVKQLVLTQEES